MLAFVLSRRSSQAAIKEDVVVSEYLDSWVARRQSLQAEVERLKATAANTNTDQTQVLHGRTAQRRSFR